MNKVLRMGSIIVASGMMYIFLTRFSKANLPFPVAILATLSTFLGCLFIWWKEKDCPKVKKSDKSKSNFDWSMHYFRAFAILAIMMCHYAALYGYKKLNLVLFTSSTIYFLFISGYLCQFLDAKRRESSIVYYQKKLTNVICPFILFSILFGVLNGDFSFSLSFVKEVLMGKVQGQYWYIPFVSFLFLASPLICRMRNSTLLMTVAITGGLFILFPFRTSGFTLNWPDVFFLYTNFTFFYIFGILYFRFKAQFENMVKRFYGWFVVGAVFTALLIWNPDIMGLRYSNIGIVVDCQRFMTLFCIIGILMYLCNKHIWLLDNIAKLSFTLYFIHFGFLVQFKSVRLKLLETISLPVVITEILIYISFVLVMLLVAIVLKKALGKWSRPLIGA